MANLDRMYPRGKLVVMDGVATRLMHTWVVHCKKKPYDIYIGRPSESYDVYIGRSRRPGEGKWGNPFSHLKGTLAEFQVATREEAIERYREWVVQQPELMASLHELRGKVLGCWCDPQPCHGWVLAELADR